MTFPPIPPSDNLYKFTAIGGLILMGLSVYVPLKLDAEIDTGIIEVRSQIEELCSEIGQHRVQMLALSEMEKSFETAISSAPRSLDYLARVSRIEKRFEVIAEQAKEMDKINHLSRQIETALAKIQLLMKRSVDIGFFVGMFFTAGVLMVWGGFSNWYFKYQVPKDRILQAQAEYWTKSTTKAHDKEEVPG